MILRKYKSSDCKYLVQLFYHTVHTVNANDYTKEQLDVWATDNVDIKEWDRTLSEHYTVVAVKDNSIVGFGDIDQTGYLDRLYVHKNHQRRGIASAICNELETVSDADQITVHASITARPFFLSRGYEIVKKQQVIRQGIFLDRYIMKKKNKPCVERRDTE